MEHELKEDLRAEIGLEDYVVGINSANHQWTSDEPVPAGGKDRGPSPYELLLSSLASCTLITLRMYANRKQWNLQSAKVSINFTFEDIEGVRESKIKRNLILIGDLSEEQKERLLYIAKVCPVAKILAGQVTIDTILGE